MLSLEDGKKEVCSIAQSCKFPYTTYAHSCKNAIGSGTINYLEKGFLISDHFVSTSFFYTIKFFGGFLKFLRSACVSLISFDLGCSQIWYRLRIQINLSNSIP